MADQMVHNWLKAQDAGHLGEASAKPFKAEQIEIARLKAELARVKMERDIFKKSGGVFREEVAVRYSFIERHRTVWPIITQCRARGVSVSGLSEYRARQKKAVGQEPSPSKSGGGRLSDKALLIHIRTIFFEMKGAYGWPPIWRELATRNIRAGKERVRKLMLANGLRARGKKKFRVTMDSGHRLPVSPDLLEERLDVEEANRVWNSDITYV